MPRGLRAIHVDLLRGRFPRNRWHPCTHQLCADGSGNDYARRGAPASASCQVPIQHVKDMFQFRVLHAFGGWWWDLDVIWLPDRAIPTGTALRDSLPQDIGGGESSRGKPRGASCAAPPNALAADLDVVLFAQFEKVSGAFVKKAENLLRHGRQAMSVNLGVMWAKANCSFLEICSRSLGAEAANHKTRLSTTGVADRLGRQWCRQQELVQELATKQRALWVAPPMMAYGTPRWAKSWDSMESSGESYGREVPSLSQLAKGALMVNLWVGVWPLSLSQRMLKWATEVQAQRQRAWAALGPCPGGLSPLRGTLTGPERMQVMQVCEEAASCLANLGFQRAMIHMILGTAMEWLAQRELPMGPSGEGESSHKWLSVALLLAATKFHARKVDQGIASWQCVEGRLLEHVGLASSDENRAGCARAQAALLNTWALSID